MSDISIFLDESGDLGWKFDKPYHNGGSSRYLTIGAVVIPHEKRYIIQRFMKGLYRKFKWDINKEKKWSGMNSVEKMEFLRRAENLALKESPDAQLFAITVKKERVMEHIRADPNKLYNYMIKLLLVEKMSEYDKVFLFPDIRSIKVKSGHSLHDYLQTVLWFESSSRTILETNSLESSKSLGIQFADMLSGAVQFCFEKDDESVYARCTRFIRHKKLYFS
ncbi:MAG: DUF3800 domain-containing protein [Helicobacteraceae bacterium]|nr:DUF3800 domain-containing protein [Helicobacteraceae bacterium]